MKVKKKVMLLLVVVLCIVGTIPSFASVSLPSISSGSPIKCYTLKSSGRIYAYTASNLRRRTGGYIDCSTDECSILRISGNAVQAKYPVSRGSQTAWFARSEFSKYNLANGAEESWTQEKQVTVYQRADGKTSYGYISAGDTCYKLSESGDYKQVIYSLANGNGYKMGWIAKKDNDNDNANDSSQPVPDGLYKVVSTIDKKYVWDIDGASMDNGGNLQLWKDNGSNAQKFMFTYNSDGYYTITNVNSDKVIDCAGARSADRTNIQQYTSNKSDAQKWKLMSVGDGSYWFKCKANGKMIDVSGGVASNGRNIQLYTYNSNAAAQKFTLVKTKAENKSNSDNIVIGNVTLDYALGDYFTDNGKACTKCHNGHRGKYATDEDYCNCKCTAKIGNKTYKLGSIQCLGFARYVQSALYGTNSYLSAKSFKRTGSVSASKLTEAKIKSMITDAGVGAHIRTGTNGHSMIVSEVTRDGFTVIQCNGLSNDNYSKYAKCRIGTTTYTWKSYKNSTYGKRGIKFIETYND